MSDANIIYCPRSKALDGAGSLRQGLAQGVNALKEAGAGFAAAAPAPLVGRGERPTGEPRVRIEIHDDLTAIESEWREFERQADRTAFQSYAWLANWQRHVGERAGARPAIVIGRAPDNRILFIIQLAVEADGPLRRLTWIGSRLCDYNAPLLAADFASAVGSDGFLPLWRDILRALRRDARWRFDIVDLQKMPEQLGGQPNPFLGLKVSPHPSGAYVTALAGDWKSFYEAKRSSATRKRERKQLKQLADLGELRFVEVSEPQERQETLQTLIGQKSRSFARMGVENIFDRPGYRDFYSAIARDPAARELIHISRLDVGETVAAASVGLRFGDCYALILSSYQDGDISRFGPGRAHLQELLRHTIEAGFTQFDFTIGDEPYKRDWCDSEGRVYDHLSAVTLRGWGALAAIAAFRRTKRFIKQTPVLWRAFTWARAAAHVRSTPAQ